MSKLGSRDDATNQLGTQVIPQSALLQNSGGSPISQGGSGTLIESDPIFVASAAYNISSTNISNWNSAYGWGDHSAMGYLTVLNETDPIFIAWDKSTGISITESQISDFGTYSTDIHSNISSLNLVSGTNTGDETITTIKTKLGAADNNSDGYLTYADWNLFNGKQDMLTGIGFVKSTGGIISYDNSTYLTTTLAGTTYVPYTGALYNVVLGAHTLSTTSGLITPKIYPASDSITALQINKADGTTNVINVDTTNGYTGFGISTPIAKVDIHLGNLNLDNTTFANQYGIITKGGVTFLHNFEYGNNGTVTPLGHNLFIGKDAGNLTMGSTTTSDYESSNNIGIGFSTLINNTAGYDNIAIGTNCLHDNSDGSGNIGLGVEALHSNTTGILNIAIGDYALGLNTEGYENIAISNSLYNNTIGNRNIAVGHRALYYNITGSNNIAIGTESGNPVGTGSSLNLYGSDNIFIGYNTKAYSDTDTNQIVIGYEATGNGSNTITLGNSGIISNYLKGLLNLASFAYSGTLNGSMWNDATQKCFKVYEDGMPQYDDKTLFIQTNTTTLTNSTTETTLFNTGIGALTIPNNSLVPGKTIRVNVKGIISAANGHTSTLRLKLGSTLLTSSTGTFGATTTDSIFVGEFEFTCRTIGATGTVIGQGRTFISGGTGFATVTMRELKMTTVATIDTTIAHILDITYQWGTASTSDSISITNAMVNLMA